MIKDSNAQVCGYSWKLGLSNRDRPPKHPLEDDSAWYIPHPERQFVNITEAAKLGDLDSLRVAFKVYNNELYNLWCK